MRPFLHNVPPKGTDPVNATVVHRRVEITVEREAISVVYQPGANITGQCEQCGKEVLMLTAEAAAAARSTTPRKIYRWLGDEWTDSTEVGMQGWLRDNPQGRYGPHQYSLEQWGFSRRDLIPYFSDYLKVHPVATAKEL